MTMGFAGAGSSVPDRDPARASSFKTYEFPDQAPALVFGVDAALVRVDTLSKETFDGMSVRQLRVLEALSAEVARAADAAVSERYGAAASG